MRGIPKSITVRVERADGLLRHGEDSSVKAAFYRVLGVPKSERYSVTYVPNRKGPYRVVESGTSSYWPVLERVEREVKNNLRFVCFLKPYIGLRVTREVKEG
jgi:hypothetical protein